MPNPTATEIEATATLKHELEDLQRERTTAILHGLSDIPRYMRALEQDIAALEAAYVVAAVTGIASLRAELDAPLEG